MTCTVGSGLSEFGDITKIWQIFECVCVGVCVSVCARMNEKQVSDLYCGVWLVKVWRHYKNLANI